MSQKMADSIIAKLRKDAALIAEMCGIYPGDPDGDMLADAWTLLEMAEILDEMDWDTMRAHFKEQLPKVEVTYYEDPIDERLASGICSDRDQE